MTALDEHPKLSIENPWPGLDSFGEDDCAFFRGRDQEAENLLKEVLRASAVVLYGMSGSGKTSLVRAGLSSRLAAEDYFLVPVRLTYGPSSPAIAEQIFSVLVERCPKSVRRADRRDGESLWEYLHRREPAIEGVQPLFFFDQFEELFTTGAATEHQKQARTELKALIEGTAPPDVRDRLAADPQAARALTLQQHRYRVLVAIRDDFVAQLELLRGEIPSVVQHRFGLLPLNGDRALEAVMQSAPGGKGKDAAAGQPLVERSVAEQIVRTVAPTRELETHSLAELQVEPALLSVMCQELNLKRLERQKETGTPARITSDLVTGNRAEILTGFYERAVAGVPDGVRRFIEDRLVTELGYRTSAVRDEALIAGGLTETLLAGLIKHRLLRTVERSGVVWIELTHDVLTAIIMAKRRERRERELAAERELEREALLANERDARSRRQRRVVVGAGICILAALAGLGSYSWVRAQEADTQSKLARAAEEAAKRARAGRARAREVALNANLEAHRVREALAELALSVRKEPDATWKRLLLVDMLRHGSWALPLSPLFPPGPLTWVTCAMDAPRCAAAYRDGRVLVRGDASLDGVGPWKGYADLFFSNDGKRLTGVPEASGTGVAWTIPSGARSEFEIPPNDYLAVGANSGVMMTSNGLRITLQRLGDTTPPRVWTARISNLPVAVSSDGRRAAFRDDLTSVAVVDSDSGRRLPIARHESAQVTSLDLSLTGDLLAIGTIAGTIEILRLPDGALLGSVNLGRSIDNTSFQPRGSFVAISTLDGALFSWRSPWNADVLRELAPAGGAQWSGMTWGPAGKNVAAARRDGAVRVWDVSSGISRLAPIHYGAYTLADFLDDSRLVTVSLDGATGAWKLAAASAPPILKASSSIFAAWFAGEHDVHVDAISDGLDWSEGNEKPELRRAGCCAYVSRDRRHRVWHWANKTELEDADGGKVQTLGTRAQLVAFSRDGHRLLTVIDGKAQIWSADDSAKPLGPALEGTVGAWLSRDGSLLVTKGTEPGATLHVLSDERSYAAAEALPGSDVISGVGFDPLAQRLIVISECTAKIFDRRLGKYVGLPLVHQGGIAFADFSPDGRWIVTASVDRTARVWDAATGHPASDWLIHDARVNAADFAPDGRRLLTADDDGHVRIWDVLSGEEANDEQAHRLATLAEIVAGMRIDPDTDQMVDVDQRAQDLTKLMGELGLDASCQSAPGGATRPDCGPEMEQLLAAIFAHK